MDEIKNKLILHLRLNKLDNSGIFPPIILNELLIHKGFTDCKLKQGFISLNNEGHCWHIWNENNENKVIDINQEIACRLNEYFRNVEFNLSTDVPEKFDKNDDYVAQWELYNNDKKKFWKEQPMKIRDFRSKIFKVFKNKLTINS